MRRLINRLRLARGLHWRGAVPRPAELGFDLRNLLIVAVILLAYGLAGRLDAATEQAIEAERQADQAALQQAALLACLNGGSPGLYTTDSRGVRHYIVCSEPYTITDENLLKRNPT